MHLFECEENCQYLWVHFHNLSDLRENNIPSAAQWGPCIVWNPSIKCRFHSYLPFVSILQTDTSYFSKIYLTIIFPPALITHRWLKTIGIGHYYSVTYQLWRIWWNALYNIFSSRWFPLEVVRGNDYLAVLSSVSGSVDGLVADWRV